ncbi:hypothetical protein LUZ60_001676 [Juncus effusus]|nr:hypothetical protein LUZ60_001676 [Juncus effusus]
MEGLGTRLLLCTIGILIRANSISNASPIAEPDSEGKIMLEWKKVIHRSLSHARKWYTVLINTWKRNDLLKRSVVHYASCVGVDLIHVVWSERDPLQDSLKTNPKTSHHKIKKIHRDNIRLKVRRHINTEGGCRCGGAGRIVWFSQKAVFFFDKMYPGLYMHQMLPSIWDYVSNNRKCEDIAISFLVANVTGSPPIWVQGKIDEIGLTRISSLGGHIEMCE